MGVLIPKKRNRMRGLYYRLGLQKEGDLLDALWKGNDSKLLLTSKYDVA